MTVARRPWSLIVVLLGTGTAGLWASFALTLDKIHLLQDPDAQLSCSWSPLVTCGPNLNSWQGRVFFDVPNPIWGLMGFVAPIAVAVAVLAGARFARWFWLVFNLGVAAALGFCIFLWTNSIYDLHTLCPWCMLTWAATILMFWTLTLHNLREGRFGVGRRLGRALYPWVPALTIGTYLVIAIQAQLELDFLRWLV